MEVAYFDIGVPVRRDVGAAPASQLMTARRRNSQGWRRGRGFPESH